MMDKDYAIIVKPRIEISSIDEEICNIVRDRMSMGFPNDKRKNSA